VKKITLIGLLAFAACGRDAGNATTASPAETTNPARETAAASKAATRTVQLKIDGMV
jgi:hypothetical protein